MSLPAIHVMADDGSAARWLAEAETSRRKQQQPRRAEPAAGLSDRSSLQQTNQRHARSYFVVDASTEELSFHTADQVDEHHIDIPHSENLASMQQQQSHREQGLPLEGGEAADEAFAHAIAKQYVLDAEAAGLTTTSEDAMPMPQLPGLGYVMGRDYESSMSAEKSPELGPQGRLYEYSLSEKVSGSRSASEGRAMSQRLRDEEVEDDANEASHFVSARMRYPAPQYSVKADGSLPLGAVLFACGFILLPLWWVGVIFPRKSDSEVARTWRKYNALMSLLSLPLLALFLALGGWEATHK
ncbi:hypothetical protein LPJ61_002205 [Coemansia biformis]|uniref:Transmembrane protein n=1 Tax=Coemansia biformis TaxID=1286918 RepID=A0A9W7YDS4_9FUNG|nr:hypothetical protein LPJ61_002205 [Coemansia biformis]